MSKSNIKEYKTLSYKSEYDDNDEEYFYVKGHASIFGNIDYGNDIIAKGAFLNSLLKTPEVPVLFNHDPDRAIGRSIKMLEDERGLYIEAKFPKSDADMKNKIIPQMKVGNFKEMSIGIMVKKSEYEKRENKTVRIIQDVELFEFSLVTKAMNPMAKVINFKSIESLKDVETILREKGNFSRNEAKSLIAKVKEFKGASSDRDDQETLNKSQCDADKEIMDDFINKINEFKQILNK